MQSMFYATRIFNQDISSWNVSNVVNMLSMFARDPAGQDPLNSFNQNLSGWSVANVTSCTHFDRLAEQWTLAKPNFTNCTP
jgi:surface protein